MKRIFAIISMVCALAAFVSCNKEDQKGDGTRIVYQWQYEMSLDKSSNNTITNVDPIVNAKKSEPVKYENITDAQAKAKWDSFVNAVDDSKVAFKSDWEFYTVLLKKVEVSIKHVEGDLYREVEKELGNIGKKTWRKSGATEE